MTPPAIHELSAGILAGGEGRRVGGLDKGWIDFEGRPLIEHVVQRVRPQADRVLISANRNLERCRTLVPDVVPDATPGHPGPMMGVISLLRRVTSPLLLIVPCDCPTVPTDLGARLSDALHGTEALASVAHDGERLQPLFVLLRREALASLEGCFDSGGRSMLRWLEAVGACPVDFSAQAGAFRNVNRVSESRD